MMSKCFWKVANFLLYLAKKTNLTYNEVNVILYYFIIPLTWCVMIDYIVQIPLFTLLWIVLWIMINKLAKPSFRKWCDRIFKLSQQFICFFGEYVKYSVIICIIVPITIYIILGLFVVRTI